MPNAYFRVLVAAFLFALATCKLSRTALAALDEPLETASTASWWYAGQTPDQVNSLLSANNARLVSLRVHSVNPLLLDVAMVENTGSFAKSWWWCHGLTEQQLSDAVTANNARIVNLEPYVVNGTTYFAAIARRNAGADQRRWWWYYGLTLDRIGNLVKENNARLIDLRQYEGGGPALYSAVMVENSGPNHLDWWWHTGVTEAELNQFIAQNKAYIVLDPRPGGTFNAVMYAPPRGFLWWWYIGKTEAAIRSLTEKNSARIFDMKSYAAGGERLFAVLMLSNGPTAGTLAEQSAGGVSDPDTHTQWVAAKTVFEKYNLLGTFAVDCGKPVSKDNHYYFHRVTGDSLIQRDRMDGPEERYYATIIEKAAALGPNEIAISGKRAEGSHAGETVKEVWRMEPSRHIVWEETLGGVLIAGQQAWWINKCADPGGQAEAAPASSQAGSVKAIFEKYGLMGMFASDCDRPVSKDNPYFVNRVLDAAHVQRDQMSGPTNRDSATIIDNAVELAPDKISVSGKRNGVPGEIVWRLEKKRSRAIEATFGGEKLISGGRWASNGRDVPWITKCDAAGAQAPSAQETH